MPDVKDSRAARVDRSGFFYACDSGLGIWVDWG